MSEYYSSDDNSFHPIPKASWYVLSNDKFMSGWGRSEHAINTCVVPCDSLAEAEAVEAYVRTRPEQKFVRIVQRVRSKPNVLYSIVDGWKGFARGTQAWEESLKH